LRRIVVCLFAILAATAPIAGAARATHHPLPTVTTSFGQMPKIVFPKTAAPTELSATVLEAGNGPVVARGDLLVVNYYGQIWRGRVFDTSFSDPVPSGFQIGVKAVIPGWDKTLVGQRVGSRLLLVVPPIDGYGKKGLSKAGITGTDTLVFVVDLLATYGANAVGDLNPAVLRIASGGVSVSGAPGTAPTITIAKGTAEPKTEETTVLDRGHGALVRRGLVVLQAVIANWQGKVLFSTWQNKVPAYTTVGIKSEPTQLDSLVGTPIGSRVLILVPATPSAAAEAIVVDLVAEPQGTSAQSK
jgi:peptidylprolyl isomerase